MSCHQCRSFRHIVTLDPVDSTEHIGEDSGVNELKPRPAVRIDEVFDDPSIVDRLVTAHQPYWPVQRYLSERGRVRDGERGAQGQGRRDAGRAGVPWRLGSRAARSSTASNRCSHHEPFVDAARRVFDAEIVRPHTVYANLTWQLPFEQGRGHVDIPAFRGFDRTTMPIAFLTVMGLSGLFEAERVKVATAVAWFYRGETGGFEYWPDGPREPSVVHEGAIHNTAIVADNDFMWHRVRPTGSVADGMVSLTLDSELQSDDGQSLDDHRPRRRRRHVRA